VKNKITRGKQDDEVLRVLNRLIWKINLSPARVVAELADAGVVVTWNACTCKFERKS
jgi:hypothetical protein